MTVKEQMEIDALKRMCQELAERLYTHTCTDETCAEMDCFKDRKALSNWAKLQEGKESK